LGICLGAFVDGRLPRFCTRPSDSTESSRSIGVPFLCKF
jgi:hypothetical protein